MGGPGARPHQAPTVLVEGLGRDHVLLVDLQVEVGVEPVQAHEGVVDLGLVLHHDEGLVVQLALLAAPLGGAGVGYRNNKGISSMTSK